MIAAATAEHQIVSKLLGEGTLTSAGLASMRRESEIMGLPLVEVLQLNDLISEAAVAQAYAEHSDLRFLDLTRRPPTRAWVLTVPENVARRKNCLIFGEVSGELVAVVADVGDPALALLVNDGLVGGAGLEVVVAEQSHVARLRLAARIFTPVWLLGCRQTETPYEQNKGDDQACE